MPTAGGSRPYSDYGTVTVLLVTNVTDLASTKASGMGGMAQHRHSIGDRESMHSHSGSNLQNFYANQRHQSRPNEAEQMMQAKRRMAAQRERELRNYHQEQQYNRSKLWHRSRPFDLP